MGPHVSGHLIDTNILIYWCADTIPKHQIPNLKEVFLTSFNISIISRIEFLSFNKFDNGPDVRELEFIDSGNVLPLDKEIADRAILLRRSRSIRLADAIIAATALCYDLVLITRNTDDFKSITDLEIFNPFQNES
jgi:hypothetical protein